MKMLEKIKPKDMIAALVIAAYVILKITMENTELDAAIFLILGYYFAKRHNGEDNGH